MSGQIGYMKRFGLASPIRQLQFDITLGCNIRCPMCTFHDHLHRTESVPFEVFQRIGDAVRDFSVAGIGSGSEPLVHPEWDRIVEYLSSRGLKVTLQTNGKLIDSHDTARRLVESGLLVLSFSIDGIRAETIERLRKGVSLEEIQRAIELVIEAKRRLNSPTPHLIANCVAMRSNLDEIPFLLAYLNEKGFEKVRVGFLELRKPNRDLVSESLIYDQSSALAMASELRRRFGQSMYLDLGLFEAPAERKRNACTVYRDIIYIDYRGDTRACYNKVLMGNAFEQNLQSCLDSNPYRAHVAQVTTPGNPICAACDYCNIMEIGGIEDHFGAAAIQFYGEAALTESLARVAAGETPESFWAQWYASRVR